MITSLLRRLQWLLLSILCLQVILAAPVQAHPLGNFTINQYTGFQISEHQLQINYVLDMAEIPAFQEIQTLDLDHNRRVDPEEIQDYPERTCQQLQSDLKVYRDQPADRILLSLKTADLAFPPGVGGLATLRLTCHYYGVLGSLNSSTDLHIDNQIYAHRLGWREITVMSDSIPIQSPFGSDSLSHQLTVYPDDLLSSPLDQREATLTLFPEIGSGNSPSAATAVSGPSLAGRSGDLMTDLLTLKHLTPITMLGALILAFVWGGFHALTPGHGKTLVGAYLVGSKGTPRHAICLGLTTTLAHTSSVFLLGLIALIASQFLITEALYPWLSLISGGMIVGVGLYLFRQRLQDLDHSHSHHHDHSHSHHHDHHHPHGHHYLMGIITLMITITLMGIIMITTTPHRTRSVGPAWWRSVYQAESCLVPPLC